MAEFVAHYLRRGKELGFVGALQRGWTRTLNGLSTRGQALWWGWKARRGLGDHSLLARTTGEWDSVDALLEHLARRRASSFMLPHESGEEAGRLLDLHYPDHAEDVLTRADAACRNQLQLLGKTFSYAGAIDWLRDPVTGWRWPTVHRSRLERYLGPMRPVDLIRFWELNRHQHFITLGVAYFLTGNEKYVDAFCCQIEDWIRSNPVQHGVNWFYPLEMSIRLLAWTVAFQFFRHSDQFRRRVGGMFLKSLWQQADFLSHHLQCVRTRDDIPNNHMMAELTGLVLIGASFPEFRAADCWREIGLRLLARQAVAQTHADGVNKEQSTGYHRFVAELLLLVVARAHRGGLERQPVVEETLESMLDYVLFTLTPDGKAPMWGDSDYGRVLTLGQSPVFWDFRPILSAGAALFGRPDWKYAASSFGEEAFWLLGIDGLSLWDAIRPQPPEQTSRSFPDAGIYIIRDAWSAETDVAFFRCGPFGLGGEGHCAHAHCDLLSFILWVKGRPVLVDSGTYLYHGSLRDHFRLTAAHNTVMIDGSNQAVPMPNFNWKYVSQARCLGWNGQRVTGGLDYAGEMEFIRELGHPRPGVWEVRDQLKGHGQHNLEWFFHFWPGLELSLNEIEHTVTVANDGGAFVLVQIPDGGIRLELTDAWYSCQYGVKQANRVLHAVWNGEVKGGGVLFQWQFRLAGCTPTLWDRQ